METALWMLDYGHKVKVLEGENKGKEGYVVYASRMGHICINTNKKPDRKYHITEKPSNLEITSMENSHNITPLPTEGLSEFDCVKLEILIRAPEAILKYQEYFNKQIIDSAKNSIKNRELMKA